MKYNKQFEEIIARLLPLEIEGSSPEQIKKDIHTLAHIYAKKDERLNRIIKLSDKQQMAILELNEELDDYKRNLEKKVEEEIRKRQEQEALLLEQSRLAAIAEMIDAVAHQWTQPLNVLSMQIDLLNLKATKHGTISAQTVHEFKQNASLQIQHMSETLINFRNFFKPMDDPHPFSVHQMVKDALTLIQNEMERTHINILLEVEKDFQIVGNIGEFKHIVLNLINNAKYAFEEHMVENREIVIRILGEEKRIEVIDNAGGIAPEIIDDLFELRSTTKGKDGSGIGLYMSAKIAEKHQGTLKADNTATGARFIFQLKEQA